MIISNFKKETIPSKLGMHRTPMWGFGFDLECYHFHLNNKREWKESKRKELAMFENSLTLTWPKLRRVHDSLYTSRKYLNNYLNPRYGLTRSVVPLIRLIWIRHHYYDKNDFDTPVSEFKQSYSQEIISSFFSIWIKCVMIFRRKNVFVNVDYFD